MEMGEDVVGAAGFAEQDVVVTMSISFAKIELSAGLRNILRSTHSAVVVSEAEFVDRLYDPGLQSKEFKVQLRGGEIAMNVRRGTQPSLVVAFQGAVDQAKWKMPSYVGFVTAGSVRGSQLMIADPSLERSPALATSWYLGHSGFDLPKLLPPLLDNIVSALGASRTVFLGYSAGDFAALYYSWRMPGSVAVALNPQTNIARYYRRHMEVYRGVCWPDLTSVESLFSTVEGDLTTLYSKGFSNTVIYLQNSMDLFHLKEHFAPFLTSIGKNLDRLITKVDFWGGFGHASIPKNEWIRWIAASLVAPTTSINDILVEYQREMEVRSTSGEISRGVDFEIAKRLSSSG